MSKQSENKFKVGDKVKIILKDDSSWNEDVTELIGKIVTIKECRDYNKYRICEDGGRYEWFEEDFELIEEDNMMRYKAGDKVVLRSDLELNKKYGWCYFENSMSKNIGQVVKIKDVWDYDYMLADGTEFYTLTDGTKFYTDEMIDHKATEEVNDKEKNKMKVRYEIGDRVVIREDLIPNESYNDLDFDEDMCDYMGQTLTIVDVDYQGDYTVRECEEFYFNDEMIDHLITKELQWGDVVHQHIFDKLSITKDDLMFTKSNLKSGHAVKLRSGEVYVVMKNEFGGEDYMFNQKTKGHMELTDYNEDLIFSRDKGLDIIKVYEPLATYALKGVGDRVFNTSNDIDKYFKLVYEKKEPKEMTLKEVEKQLGHKIKLVKETIE